MCNDNFFSRVWAALIFFTRLPLWRLYQPPRRCYDSVVEHWPLAGWLTGIVMAAVIYFGSLLVTPALAAALAIVARLFMTGALHEDGLADFFDGFGGGSDRERVLAIMKDSRIGTFGVLALMAHFLILWLCLSSMPPHIAAAVILAADPYSKMVAGQIIQILPYARTAETAKAGIVYRRISVAAGIILFLEGMLPMVPLFVFYGDIFHWQLVIFTPCVVFYFLYLFIRRRLHGYTGDCCGAVCLILETTFLLTACFQLNSLTLINS